MTVSEKKLKANRANARRGGRPSRRQDIETDRLMQEILQRADARTAKMVARKLLKAIEAGDATMPATPTNAAKATDGIDALVEQLIAYSGAKELSAVTWQQVYGFCKREDIDGSPRRTELFRAWQNCQPMPDIPGLESGDAEIDIDSESLKGE